jgi:hypothetical protein
MIPTTTRRLIGTTPPPNVLERKKNRRNLAEMIVLRGLDPPAHLQKSSWERIDCRVKPGHNRIS